MSSFAENRSDRCAQCGRACDGRSQTMTWGIEDSAPATQVYQRVISTASLSVPR
jgi:hypothetical protein